VISAHMETPPGRDVDPRMRIISNEPLNAETSLPDHAGVITPTPLFYHRNHFAFPLIADHGIDVDGLVDRTLRFNQEHLLSLPSRTLTATLECAGNGREGFQPATEGEPWQYSAVSTAEWTGVSLATVLQTAGVRPQTMEIVIQGADSGHVAGVGAEITYSRSLPIEKAMDGDVLLAYAMNGEWLSAKHGAPVRLLVPGWYGMASVKWVTRITAVSEPFRGFYQADRYVLSTGDADTVPLSTMRVRSLITIPTEGARVPRGRCLLRGMAWSGEAPVTRVEVSVDGGKTWGEALFSSDGERYAWRRWEFPFEAASAGSMTILSRAYDEAGNSQPDRPLWNRLGYANNAIEARRIRVAALGEN
jgi:sulfite oxidase